MASFFEQEIRNHVAPALVPGALRVYDSIDSTNEEARRQAVGGAVHGSLYVADSQTAGRGRRGRHWSSPAGENLFYTLLLRPDLTPQETSMITLITALAAVRTVEKQIGVKALIKWPNDLVLHERKICGILTELGMKGAKTDYVIIGVGWNLNRTDFEEDIAHMAGSVLSETGIRVERGSFLSCFLQEFFPLYEAFMATKSLAFMQQEYNDHLINAGRQVRVIREGREDIRVATGIDETGRLIVKDETGQTEVIFSGEVSVRGLYGYV